MNGYQKVVRGRDTLKKLPELMVKLGISKPMIVGMQPLTGTLMKKLPALLSAPVFSEFHPNPDLADTEAAIRLAGCAYCVSTVTLTPAFLQMDSKMKAGFCAGQYTVFPSRSAREVTVFPFSTT